MKHPIKMSRIKHILTITLSLLLIAIIADAQVSQRRRAQPPQPQANKYEYKNKLFTHECKRGECFDIYHTNNDEYFVKRLNDCRQPIYIRYGFRKKGTEEKRANTRTFYLSQYDKGPFKLNCSKTPQGYDLAFDYFNTTDNKEIRKRIGQPKTYKGPYMHDYTLTVTNRTNDRLIVNYVFWSKDHFSSVVSLSIAPHGEAIGAGGTNGVVYYTEARPDADQNSDKLMPSY